MHKLQWIVLTLSLIQGGWLTFDGGRALIVGDYLTPSSGPGAGELGPWSRIISALGLDPRSPLVKGLHLVLGIAWIIALVLFAVRPAIGWYAVFICSVATLWYLPIGTVLSIVISALLWTPAIRSLP